MPRKSSLISIRRKDEHFALLYRGLAVAGLYSSFKEANAASHKLRKLLRRQQGKPQYTIFKYFYEAPSGPMPTIGIGYGFRLLDGRSWATYPTEGQAIVAAQAALEGRLPVDRPGPAPFNESTRRKRDPYKMP